MYQDIYNCICQNTKKLRFIIHYVKSTAQLFFKKFDFQKVDQHAAGKWLIHIKLCQDSRFKIQNSFIASHQTYYDIQHRHISISDKYQYKYSNKLSWEQRELEILWDLWAPCLFHI